MRRNALLIVLAITIFVALLAVVVPMIQFGTASQSQTDSEANYGSDCYVKVSNTMLQVPSVEYDFNSDQNAYVPRVTHNTVSGTLHTHVPEGGGAKLRVMVTFDKPLSWVLLQTLDLEIKPSSSEHYSTYSIYDASDSSASWLSGTPTLAIDVDDGDYIFRLSAFYTSAVKMDPRPYQGDNMTSNVTFIIEELDPIQSQTLDVIFNYDDGGVNDEQLVDQANPLLKQPIRTKSGYYSLAGWKLTKINDDSYTGPDEYYDSRGNIADLLGHGYDSVELTADWGRKVTYDQNDSDVTGFMNPQAVGSRSVPLSPLGFDKNGYTFVEWNNERDGSGTDHYRYEDNDMIPGGISEDITLYAQWV